MREIPVHFPRTLVLENVVSTKARLSDPRGFQATALSVVRFIRAQGASVRGPLIQVNRAGGGSGGSTGGDPQSVELLRQADRPVTDPTGRFTVTDRIVHRNCLMARFEGDVGHLHIVYSKLAVASYEQEIPLSGVFYVVFVSEAGTELTADVFALTDVADTTDVDGIE